MRPKVFYSKFFPPPKFLEMPSVSLEILSHGISYLMMKTGPVGPVPDKYGLVPLAPGDVAHGDILKRDVVVKALIEVKKRTHADFVRFSIPEEKTYIFKTHLPNLSAKEIRDILEFKLEENVPLTAKEAVFDYDIVPTKKNSGLDLIVSVAPLKTIEEFQEIIKMAGFTSVLFSPESNNLAKAIIHRGNEQVIVAVNIRENNIILSLIISGIVYQTSSINFGGSTITDLLVKFYKISPAEAIQMKKNKLYADTGDNMELFSYLINTLSALKDELYKFILYCNEREDVVGKVDRVLLSGQDSLIIGLTEYLSVNLGLPVEVANVWVNNFSVTRYVPEISRQESLNFTVVNGLNLL